MVEVKEHIDYPIVAKTHPSMYLMHKYWARKPHNVVAKYIERYTEEGDVVNAFACVNYAHGWLDAGARLGVLDTGGDDQLSPYCDLRAL